MNTCASCKYWGTFEPVYPTGVNKTCDNPGIAEAGNLNEDRTDQLVYSYDEGGWFTTGPDFGCIHHEPKPTE